MIRRRATRLGIAALLGAGLAPLAADEPRPVWLGGPDVTLSSWGASALRAADLDGDGRNDLLVADPGSALVRWYRQRAPGEEPPARRAAGRARWEPVLEDARFEETTIPVGSPVLALAVADLDGDGLADLAMTTAKEPLLVLFQDEGGEWSRREKADGFKVLEHPATLAASDLDADGRTDLVVLAAGELLVFLGGPEGRLEAPSRLPTSGDGGFGLIVEDLDGDGRPDLQHTVVDSDQGWRVRFQLPPVLGSRVAFGPERAIDVRVAGSGAAVLRGLPGGPALAVVEGSTSRTEVARLAVSSAEDKGLARWRAETLAVGTSDRAPARFGVGDLDGDGRLDLVAGDPRSAKVTLFRQRPDGRFGESSAYPTLANLSSLVVGDVLGDGKPRVIVASDKDELIGLCSWMGEGAAARLSFPEPLAGFSGSPSLLAVVSAGAGHDLAIVVKRSNKFFLETWRSEGGKLALLSAEALPELRREPEFARVGDLDGDGRHDLLIGGRDAAQVLIRRIEGTWRPAAETSGLRRTMLAGVDATRVSVLDLDRDGIDEILLADQGFVRVLGLSAGGIDLVAKDQLTARQGEDRLLAPVLLPWDDGRRAVVCATGAGPMQALLPGVDGVWRFEESADIPPLVLRDQWSGLLAPGGEPTLLLFGTDRVHLVSPSVTAWERDVLASHESDLLEVEPTYVEVGDLNEDGVAEVIAIDSRRSVVEILGLDAREAKPAAARGKATGRAGRPGRPRAESTAWELRPILHFEVFETNPFANNRRSPREPREVLVADVTGDGLDDLVCLVHDRILVYPQLAFPATGGEGQ